MSVTLRYAGQSGLSLAYEVVSQLGGDVVEGSMVEVGTTGVYLANPTGLAGGHHTAKILFAGNPVQRRPLYVSGGSDESVAGSPTTINTSPEMPLLWAVCRLVEAGVYTESQSDLGLKPEPQPVPGSSYCRVRYGEGFPSDFDAGMGSFGIGVDATAIVRCYLRADTDRPQSDTRSLSALYRKFRDVVAAIHGRPAEDAAGNSLTAGPLMIAGFPSPQRYRADRQWIYVDVPFSMTTTMGSDDSATPTEC